MPNTVLDWKRVSLHSKNKSSTTGDSSAHQIVNTTLHAPQGHRKPARHYSEQMRVEEQPAFELILLIMYWGNGCQSRRLGMYSLFLSLFVLEQHISILDNFKPSWAHYRHIGRDVALENLKQNKINKWRTSKSKEVQ